jgi:hypothetical protein
MAGSKGVSRRPHLYRPYHLTPGPLSPLRRVYEVGWIRQQVTFRGEEYNTEELAPRSHLLSGANQIVVVPCPAGPRPTNSAQDFDLYDVAQSVSELLYSRSRSAAASDDVDRIHTILSSSEAILERKGYPVHRIDGARLKFKPAVVSRTHHVQITPVTDFATRVRNDFRSLLQCRPSSSSLIVREGGQEVET